MLSYRHSFHAGNHADVLKHSVQSLILDALCQKETPFVYIDTHAGAGRYDLRHEWAEKTGEYQQGIARLWQYSQLPSALTGYLSAIQALNQNNELRYYPGSPRVARHFLRPQDRALLSELHPSDFPLLQQEFDRDRQVRAVKEDGFAQLKAHLPPKERRGLVLIDPPYEQAQEYQAVVNAITQSHKRWATGIYALWYPVVNRHLINTLTQDLVQSGIRKILRIELGVEADRSGYGMTASGMIVINPPWKLAEQMQQLLPELQHILAPEHGHFTLEWLVTE